MAGKHQRAARGAIVEHLAPADDGLRGVGVLREIPVRIIDLQQVMPDVADEGGALALAFELEEDVAGRMAGRRIDLDEIVEPVRPRRSPDRPCRIPGSAPRIRGRCRARPGLLSDRHRPWRNNRRPAWRRRSARSGRSAPICRPSAACSSRHDRDADACTSPCRSLPAGAGGGQPLEIGLVEHVPERPAGLVLVVAAAAVDQDGLAADLQQPAMHRQP